MSELVGKLSQGVEYYKGERGPKGDAFTYEDFTQEQLNALKGQQGEPGRDGIDGKDFTYDDFTPEQLEALKGQQGEPGQDGVSVSHTWNGTSLSITSASGTSEMDLRGPAGQDGYTPVKGVDYFDGEPGPAGQDYVLTQDDKTAIANIVIGILPTAEEVNV